MKKGYRRLSRWADKNPLAAYVLLILTFSFALWQIGQAVEDINTERSARSEVVAGVINQFCEDNNGQDDTLAALVAASLKQSGGGFGEGVDTSQLTAFDVQVIASIQRIQAASGQKANMLTDIFQKKLEALRKRQDCEELVQSFVTAG